MIKHTKGPWHMMPGPKRGLLCEWFRIVGADGETVATLSADATMGMDDGAIAEVCSPQLKANANLMSAAPDMLKALLAMWEWQKSVQKHLPIGLAGKVQRAIAKAEGRS